MGSVDFLGWARQLNSHDAGDAFNDGVDRGRADRQFNLRRAVSAQAAAGDYQGAEHTALAGGDLQYHSAIKALDDAGRAEAAHHVDLIAAGANSLLALRDPVARQTAWQSTVRPELIAQGIPAAEIEDTDLSDAGLQTYVSTALTLKEQLERFDKLAERSKPVAVPMDSRLVTPTLDPATGAVSGSTTLVDGNPKGVLQTVTRRDGSTQSRLINPYTGAPIAGSGAAASVPSEGSQAGALSSDQVWRDFVAPHEGGYAPHDANGAPVNFGINQSANPGVDVRTMTRDQASQIFRDKYWTPSGASNLPPALAAVHADTYFINPSRAQQFLAQSGGDANRYMALREAWMAHLEQADPAKYGRYAHAWSNRNRDLRAYSAQHGGAPSGDGGVASGSTDPSVFDGGTDGGSNAGNGLSDSDIEYGASQFNITGKLPSFGMGKISTEDKERIFHRAAQQAARDGKSGRDVVVDQNNFRADAATLTTLRRNQSFVRTAESTALSNMNNYLAAARALPLQSGFKPLDRVTNGVMDWTGNAHMKALETQAQAVANEVAKVLASTSGFGGTLTDSARQEQLHILQDPGQPYESRAAAVNELRKDMAARVVAQDREIARIQSRLSGGSSASNLPQGVPSGSTFMGRATKGRYAGQRIFKGPDGHLYGAH